MENRHQTNVPSEREHNADDGNGEGLNTNGHQFLQSLSSPVRNSASRGQGGNGLRSEALFVQLQSLQRDVGQTGYNIRKGSAELNTGLRWHQQIDGGADDPPASSSPRIVGNSRRQNFSQRSGADKIKMKRRTPMRVSATSKS